MDDDGTIVEERPCVNSYFCDAQANTVYTGYTGKRLNKRRLYAVVFDGRWYVHGPRARVPCGVLQYFAGLSCSHYLPLSTTSHWRWKRDWNWVATRSLLLSTVSRICTAVCAFSFFFLSRLRPKCIFRPFVVSIFTSINSSHFRVDQYIFSPFMLIIFSYFFFSL